MQPQAIPTTLTEVKGKKSGHLAMWEGQKTPRVFEFGMEVEENPKNWRYGIKKQESKNDGIQSSYLVRPGGEALIHIRDCALFNSFPFLPVSYCMDGLERELRDGTADVRRANDRQDTDSGTWKAGNKLPGEVGSGVKKDQRHQ
jgi:hypothetical protein